jgi:hypothetical protein
VEKQSLNMKSYTFNNIDVSANGIIYPFNEGLRAAGVDILIFGIVKQSRVLDDSSPIMIYAGRRNLKQLPEAVNGGRGG